MLRHQTRPLLQRIATTSQYIPRRNLTTTTRSTTTTTTITNPYQQFNLPLLQTPHYTTTRNLYTHHPDSRPFQSIQQHINNAKSALFSTTLSSNIFPITAGLSGAALLHQNINNNPNNPTLSHAQVGLPRGERRGSVRTTKKYEKIYEHGGLQPDAFLQFPLLEKEQVGDTRYLVKFQLPDPLITINFDQPLQYVLARYLKDGTYYLHKYYPIKTFKAGFIYLLVDIDARDDPMGYTWMTIEPGDSVELAGPFYEDFQYEPNELSNLWILAAGPTGITPVLQLLEHRFRDTRQRRQQEELLGKDTTAISVFYYNKSPKKTFFTRELNHFYNFNQSQFRLIYIFDSPQHTEEHKKLGFWDKEQLRYGGFRTFKRFSKHFDPRAQNSPSFKILVSGPKGFVQDLCGEGRTTAEGNDMPLTGWLYWLFYMDSDVIVV